MNAMIKILKKVLVPLIGMGLVLVFNSFTLSNVETEGKFNYPKPPFIVTDFNMDEEIDIGEYRFFWGPDADEQFAFYDFDSNGGLDELEYFLLPDPELLPEP